MNGKKWATTSFLVGIAVSIYGNVADSLTRSKSLGAILFASFWPIAVFLSIEVMSRVEWPRGWRWGLARFGGLGLVAAVAAVSSYMHLSALLALYGESPTVARIGPGAVDGLMILAAAALQATSGNQAAEKPAESLPDTGEGDAVPVAPPALTERPRAARRRQVATRQTQTERKEAARQAYRDSVAAGEPISYQDLAAKFRMSARWSRDRIREAKAA